MGTATIKVVGKGNYKGTIQKNFNIVKEKTKAVITCTNKPYNGSERIIATCSGGTISNARQTKPGDYTITCKGDSNHKNADNKTCSINKSDISKATVSDIPNQKYTESVITPNVVVKQGDLTLKKNVDYTLTYSKNIDAGTAVIVITGKGNYKSSKTVTFKIIKQAEITCADKQYNGIKQRIAKCSGGTISDNSLQTKVGTYTVSCTGDDTHLDAEKKVCKITSTDISTLHIEEIEDQKYTGSAITPDIVIKQGNRELIKDTDYTVIYSNNINKGTKTATAKITGKNGYTGEVIVNFSILEIIGNITLNKKSLSLNANDKFKLTATVDGEGTITWSTGNPIIARVDQEGNIVAVSPGETNIVVKSNNGKTATCKVTVTSSHKTVASYDSATLKYWVEYIENPSRTATHNGINIYNQVSTYMITHIWISNPYNQIKTAIAPQKDGKSYPRTASAASTIIGNEITKLGYQSKGLIAVNAGGDIKLTNGFCSICPSSYKGTPMTPLQIYNNTVIRDSTSETKYITESGGYGGNVAFINKNGNLDYIKFGSDVDRNKTLRNLVNERGAKYTFGLVSPYILVANYTGQLKKADIIATRQAICQIDSNNYILITSHLNGKSADSSCGESNSLNCPRIKYGLNHIDTMNIMLQYGCRTGFNLDGGGSISYLYKTNTSSTATKVNVASKERTISEVLYFVEQ